MVIDLSMIAKSLSPSIHEYDNAFIHSGLSADFGELSRVE